MKERCRLRPEAILLSCSCSLTLSMPTLICLSVFSQHCRRSNAEAALAPPAADFHGSVSGVCRLRKNSDFQWNAKIIQKTDNTQTHKFTVWVKRTGRWVLVQTQPSGTLSGRHPNLELCPEAFGAAVWLVLLVRRLLLDAAPSDGHVTARHKADICVDRTTVAAAGTAADKPRPIEQREK